MESAFLDLMGGHDKLIMDPVHGGIALFEHEMRVIDHALFQRLRNICQNDILSLVFPGATHSRFLHSIGVMHVGTRMFSAMIDAYLRDRKNRQQRELTRLHIQAIDYFSKIIRLACLLHDSGHSSFSHQFTQATKITQLMAKPGRFNELWKDVDFKQVYGNAPDKLEHEHYSIRCALEIFNDVQLIKYGIDPLDVLGLMETTEVQPTARFIEYARAFWGFIADPNTFADVDKEKNSDIKIAYMVQNFLSGIVSGEVDADRADYMLRDGFHSSVSIGSYNLDHLLSNLRFGWDLEAPWLGLAITRKGLGALEDFVYSRHQMYRQVYAHKTALGFDFILREAINEVLSDPFIFDHIDSCLSDMHNFCDLTDHFFWEAFRTHARSVQKSYSSCITQRIKLKHLKTEENIELNEVDAIRHDLAKQLKIDDDQIVTCTMKARFSNIRENFDKIKVLTKNPITGARDLQQISEVSSFFQKFSDGTIVHFYQKPF